MTNKKSFYKVRNGVICNEAAMNPEDNYPWDFGMVPTGTKCGDNMVSEMLFFALSINKFAVPYGASWSLHCPCVSGVLQ